MYECMSKLSCHLFTYSHFFQKRHIFPLTLEYSVLTGLNISVYFDYTLCKYQGTNLEPLTRAPTERVFQTG
jgi:hypothetical protein